MNKTNSHFEMQNQQARSKLKQLECFFGFFVAFFDINNRGFCKTNSSGKTLDTRQKILFAALGLGGSHSDYKTYLSSQLNLR